MKKRDCWFIILSCFLAYLKITALLHDSKIRFYVIETQNLFACQNKME